MASRQVCPLASGRIASMRRAAFTYPEVGATERALPSGYRHLRESAELGSGDETFTRASAALLTWQVQLGAGLEVRSSDAHMMVGSVAVLSVRFGPLRLDAPVRVIDVVDAGPVASFTYGTLPGHPESGEERFEIRHREDEAVVFTVVGFSRPQSHLARVAGPFANVVQDAITRRYLATLVR